MKQTTLDLVQILDQVWEQQNTDTESISSFRTGIRADLQSACKRGWARTFRRPAQTIREDVLLCLYDMYEEVQSNKSKRCSTSRAPLRSVPVYDQA